MNFLCNQKYILLVTGDGFINNNSIQEEVFKRMNHQPRNTIFTNSEFYTLGTKSAIKVALSRLANKGLIFRIMDGYYVIPAYSEFIQEYSYPSVEALVEKIADKYAWNISPFGETALNQVGLSTQVPVVNEYISDGPSREYVYGKRKIKFKHTSNRTISRFSLPLSLVIKSIRALGKDRITSKDIKKLASFCKRYVEEDLIENTNYVPEWIFQILKRIRDEMINVK